MPAPEENREELYRYLLVKNHELRELHLAIGPEDGIYLVDAGARARAHDRADGRARRARPSPTSTRSIQRPCRWGSPRCTGAAKPQ